MTDRPVLNQQAQNLHFPSPDQISESESFTAGTVTVTVLQDKVQESTSWYKLVQVLYFDTLSLFNQLVCSHAYLGWRCENHATCPRKRHGARLLPQWDASSQASILIPLQCLQLCTA